MLSLILLLVTAPNSVRAVFTATPPTLDGKLDDPQWQTAEASSAFTQKAPNEAQPPSERTVLRVLYDYRAVYVAFECTQRSAPVLRPLGRRDTDDGADWVAVSLGSRRDGRRAFELLVTAAGVLTDLVRYDDVSSDLTWDENWDARVDVAADGWTAELEIPLRVLRYDSLPVQDWALQARRYIAARQELDEWAYIPQNAGAEVSLYGKLTDLAGLDSNMQLELTPFFVTRLRHREVTPGVVANGVDFRVNGGGDVRWHPSQALTLDVTVNPDFGQAEADERLLNLTSYETFLSEKRRFFLEGVDTFATPLQLVYTRRIGRPGYAPVTLPGEQLVDLPEPAPIHAAAKLSGRLGEHWTIGAMTALVGENAVEVSASGARSRRVTDPLASLNAFRLRREIGSSADVGVLFTGLLRVEQTRQYPALTDGRVLCPSGRAVDAGSRCFNDAFTGAVDWRWRSPGGDFASTGQLAFSVLHSGPPRVQRDGSIVRPGEPGLAGIASFQKEGGPVVGALQVSFADRKFDPNDMGYSSRANRVAWSAAVRYRKLEPFSIFRQASVGFAYDGQTNLSGQLGPSSYSLNTQAVFANAWSTTLELRYDSDYLDDRELGTGAVFERPGRAGGTISLATAQSAAVSGAISGSAQGFAGGVAVSADLTLRVRVGTRCTFDLGANVEHTRGERRFLGEDGEQWLFGALDATGGSVTLRASLIIAPRLSLQGYGQLFVAAERARDLAGVAASASPVVRLAALRPANQTAPAQGTVDLNVSAVLRWEYALGSTLLLVYTRAQSAPDPTGLSRAPAADVVMIKIGYWFDPVDAIRAARHGHTRVSIAKR